jgi:predicted GNAT family acetyltransferase
MTDITLYGEVRCHKTRFYQTALEERGLDFELAEVDKDPDAARRLAALTGSADKFPTFQIKGRKLRNPKLPQLEKVLARSELYDPGLVHDEKSQRFIRHMAPSDAFVSYVWQGDRMILTHIEVAPMLRGKGLGARFAIEVLEEAAIRPHEVRLTCSFLRRVAGTRQEWRQKFNLEGKI